MKIGSKIIINNKPDSCCGVLVQGWKDEVVDRIITFNHNSAILVLKSGALVWEKDVEESE